MVDKTKPEDLPVVAEAGAADTAAEVQALLRAAAPDAVRVLVRTMRRRGNIRESLNAAKTVLALAGHVAPAPPKIAGDDVERELADLKPADLRRIIDDLEGELAARAKPVNAPANRPPIDKTAELLE